MVVAFVGLHFDGNVDATGVATVLLAIATAGLAAYTRRAVQQGATELAQSQRPVLIPVREDEHERPQLYRGQFLLPVINVGVGPAMDVRAELEFGDAFGRASAAPSAWASSRRTAIGAAQQTSLEFPEIDLTDAMGFAFNIEFADVSGKRWFSRGFYSEGEQVFREVDIVDGPLSEAERARIHPRVGHA
jgi:hypothetical protein